MRDHLVNFAGVFLLDKNHLTGELHRAGLSIAGNQADASKESGLANKDGWIDYVSAVQEAERRRIAGDLHDGLGQMLTLLSIDLRSAKNAALACDAIAPTLTLALEHASACARQALEELRRSVMNLYPSMLDDLGLVTSISSLLREASQSHPQLHIESDLLVSEKEVPVALRIVAFRIVQEAVNNVLKHADAQHLCVVFTNCNGCLILTITDDGCGIRPARIREHPPCSGIAGIIRRAQASGGTIDIASSLGNGTSINVKWNIAALH